MKQVDRQSEVVPNMCETAERDHASLRDCREGFLLLSNRWAINT